MRRFRWWMALVCVLLVFGSVGCGDDEPTDNDAGQQNQDGGDNGDNVDDPPDSLEERCQAACQRIYGDGDDECDSRFSDDDGAVSQPACVDRCSDENLFRGGEWCVATEADCSDEPEEMIEACLPDDYHADACEHLGMRSREYDEIEEGIVEAINEFRTEGVDCEAGTYEPVGELQFNRQLRCGARLYNADWIDDDIDDHPGLLVDADEIREWTDRAGYDGEVVDVIPNHGERTVEHLIADWTEDDDPEKCDRMMDDEATEIGFGYSEQERGTAIFGRE